MDVLFVLLLLGGFASIIVGIIRFIIKKIKKPEVTGIKSRVFVLSGIAAILITFIGIGITTEPPTETQEASATIEEETKDDAENEESEQVVEVDPEEVETIEEDLTEDLGTNISITNIINEVKMLIDHESDGALALTSSGEEFIQTNSTFFLPNNPKEDVKTAAESIDVRELNKNATPYLSQLLTYSGHVVSIQEHTYEDDDVTLTYALVMDENFNYYTIYMFDQAEGVYEEDFVTFYGLPIGGYQFANVSGGHTNSQLFIGSIIEK